MIKTANFNRIENKLVRFLYYISSHIILFKVDHNILKMHIINLRGTTKK